MDILAKRPNLLFLIAIREKIAFFSRGREKTYPTELYRKLLITNLRQDVYWMKWQYIKEFLDHRIKVFAYMAMHSPSFNIMLIRRGSAALAYSE